MTTQDILLLSFIISKEAAFCRGESDWWPPRDDEIRLVKTLFDEGSCIDYLSQGEKVRPVVMKLRKALREFLDCAADELIDRNPKAMTVKGTVPFCEAWLNWIDTYFPPVKAQATRPQDLQQDVKRPQARKSAAARRLESPEMQEIKKRLTEARIIEEGKWAGSPAEFGELVRMLEAQWNIQRGRGKAWTDIAAWAGYEDIIKSAQNAIYENAGEVQSHNAETIRRICLNNARK